MLQLLIIAATVDLLGLSDSSLGLQNEPIQPHQNLFIYCYGVLDRRVLVHQAQT